MGSCFTLIGGSSAWHNRRTSERKVAELELACVASVSVWFRSKKRPWKGSFGFDRARNLLAPFFARSLTLAARSLLLNRTETLATQAKLERVCQCLNWY